TRPVRPAGSGRGALLRRRPGAVRCRRGPTAGRAGRRAGAGGWKSRVQKYHMWVASIPMSHVVLATTDERGYASLRRPATSRTERYALGRALRKQVPRSSLALWEPPAG